MRIAIIDAGPQSAKLAAIIAGEFGRSAAARAIEPVTDARTAAAIFVSPLNYAIDEQLERERRRRDFQQRIGLDKLYLEEERLEWIAYVRSLFSSWICGEQELAFSYSIFPEMPRGWTRRRRRA